MSDLKAFQCPNCQKFINNSMTVCKYCSFPLDEQLLSNAVADQERINKAYNAASNVRILAGSIVTFFLFSFIPFIGIIGRIAFYASLLSVPFFIILWLIRYGGLKSNDPDFASAKKYLWTAFGIWLIFPVIFVGLMAAVFFGTIAYEFSK